MCSTETGNINEDQLPNDGLITSLKLNSHDNFRVIFQDQIIFKEPKIMQRYKTQL